MDGLCAVPPRNPAGARVKERESQGKQAASKSGDLSVSFCFIIHQGQSVSQEKAEPLARFLLKYGGFSAFIRETFRRGEASARTIQRRSAGEKRVPFRRPRSGKGKSRREWKDWQCVAFLAFYAKLRRNSQK
jgi:hypothetical protein